MWSKLTVLLGLLGALAPLAEARSSGCGKSPPSSGTKYVTINGKQRQYTLQVPQNYNSNTAYKFVIAYHWLNGNMGTVVSGQYYGLLPLSAGTTIFVAPDGLNAGWANSGGEDISFTDAILQSVQESLCVDESNIFATGWSYGGSMSFSAACSRPNVFKAIAVIAGAQLSGCNGGTTPVPYLGIHGAADDVLNISLGRGLRDKYISLNGCQSKTAQEPSAGSGTHIRTDYSCRAGYPVTWVAHGGGHVPDPKDSGQSSSWAPAVVWGFFTQSGLKGDTGTTTTTTTRTTTTTQGGSICTGTITVNGGTTTTTVTPTITVTVTGNGNQQTTTTTRQTTTTTQGGSGPCASMYGQCGGQGWTGPTCCSSGTCKASNQWYSQCL